MPKSIGTLRGPLSCVRYEYLLSSGESAHMFQNMSILTHMGTWAGTTRKPDKCFFILFCIKSCKVKYYTYHQVIRLLL